MPTALSGHVFGRPTSTMIKSVQRHTRKPKNKVLSASLAPRKEIRQHPKEILTINEPIRVVIAQRQLRDER